MSVHDIISLPSTHMDGRQYLFRVTGIYLGALDTVDLVGLEPIDQKPQSDRPIFVPAGVIEHFNPETKPV